jgi:hypothetical protein
VHDEAVGEGESREEDEGSNQQLQGVGEGEGEGVGEGDDQGEGGEAMKKRGLVAVVVGMALGSSGLALAEGPLKAVVLQDNQAATFSGITCTAYSGASPTSSNIVCVRNDLKGYGVVVSQDRVVIAKRVKGKVKVVFTTKNR